MRAFAIDDFGLRGRIRELADAEPGEGEVRIKVEAAGLNGTDIAIIAGFMKDYVQHKFPLILGIDGSGIVLGKLAIVIH